MDFGQELKKRQKTVSYRGLFHQGQTKCVCTASETDEIKIFVGFQRNYLDRNVEEDVTRVGLIKLTITEWLQENY